MLLALCPRPPEVKHIVLLLRQHDRVETLIAATFFFVLGKAQEEANINGRTFIFSVTQMQPQILMFLDSIVEHVGTSKRE